MNIGESNKIAIIGAGVAGLGTARQLISAGFDCTLFERNEVLGGVWSDGYLNFGAQVQRELYEFPDWPLPEDTPNFTPGPIIQQYLHAYADHFGISPRIRLNSRVVNIAEADSSGTGWSITSESGNSTRHENFDIVVICIGLYSNQPNIPEYPGRDDFHGEVIHNSMLKTEDQLKDRRVAVIGYGKSSSDAALESVKTASQTHIVFREAHWPFPRKLAGILPFKWGLLNRLCSTLIPPYQEMTRWSGYCIVSVSPWPGFTGALLKRFYTFNSGSARPSAPGSAWPPNCRLKSTPSANRLKYPKVIFSAWRVAEKLTCIERL